MDIAHTANEDQRARRISYAGFALILLGFCVPFIAAALGYGDAANVGYTIASTAGTLLFIGLIAWVSTRKSSPSAKAQARLTTGVLLVGMVVFTTYQDVKREEESIAATRGLMAFAAKLEEKKADWEARFASIDLTKVLTPVNVTSPAGIATARATLAGYRALLTEQKHLNAQRLSAMENYVKTASASERWREVALSSMERGKQGSAPAYSAYADACVQLADAMSAVIDWGEKQGTRLSVVNGALVHSTQAQRDEMQGLLARVGEAEKRHDETHAKAQATQAHYAAKVQDAKAGMDAASKR